MVKKCKRKRKARGQNAGDKTNPIIKCIRLMYQLNEAASSQIE